MSEASEYLDKLRQQIDQYREVENIHDLPQIFHYWAGRYLAPPLNELFGTADPVQIFADTFAECAAGLQPPVFLSIGSGDCSIEVDIAGRLKRAGMDVVIECTELSPVLLGRGRKAASNADVGDRLSFTEVDINHWHPPRRYAAVMAHHSLHHIVELEHVFDQVQSALIPGGRFVISDMIGRNGHMRWPEALTLVEAIWSTLPDSKKFNQQLKRLESTFVNWDCSGEGFEGVRSQDILQLLAEGFDFCKFMAFGNLTDVFVERSFGHNYDADSDADRKFIDRVHEVNELLIDLGVLKPTMVIAIMSRQGDCSQDPVCYRGWQPRFCIRETYQHREQLDRDGADSRPPNVAASAGVAGSPLAGAGVDVLMQLRAEMRLAREATEEALAARRRAEEQLTALHASTSWRVTAPLRWLRTMTRQGAGGAAST